MHKLKCLLASMFLLFSGTVLYAQEIHHLSVQQALDYAQKHNVQVKNALIDILIQQQSNREITAAALPQISASGSMVDNLKLQTQLLPGEFFGQPQGTFVPITFGTKYITTGSVSVNQLLFDGQVFIGLKARKSSIALRQNIADITAENIRANVYKIYYQLVLSKTQVALLDSNITLIGKMRDDVQVMYDNGFAEKLDIDKNEVTLANLKTEKEKILVGVANGYNALKILLGMPVNDQLVLTDTISESMLSEDLLQAVDFRYANRRDFQTLMITRDLNRYNIKRYQYSKLPSLGIGYSYSQQSQNNEFKFNGDWFESSYIGLNISIPIFKGFAVNAQIKQARLELEKTENEILNKKNQIDNDVQSARNTWLNAIATITYQRKNMSLAGDVYQQTKKKYEIGTGSQTEVDNARTQLQTAQTNYYEALYDAIIARTDFLQAVGKL